MMIKYLSLAVGVAFCMSCAAEALLVVDPYFDFLIAEQIRVPTRSGRIRLLRIPRDTEDSVEFILSQVQPGDNVRLIFSPFLNAEAARLAEVEDERLVIQMAIHSPASTANMRSISFDRSEALRMAARRIKGYVENWRPVSIVAPDRPGGSGDAIPPAALAADQTTEESNEAPVEPAPRTGPDAYIFVLNNERHRIEREILETALNETGIRFVIELISPFANESELARKVDLALADSPLVIGSLLASHNGTVLRQLTPFDRAILTENIAENEFVYSGHIFSIELDWREAILAAATLDETSDQPPPAIPARFVDIPPQRRPIPSP